MHKRGRARGAFLLEREYSAVFKGKDYGTRLARFESWHHHFGLLNDLSAKESACKSGDPGSIPGPGRSLRENGNPLQYSCLENPMDRGAWPWGCKESDTTECMMDGWTTCLTSYVTSDRSFTSPPHASISLSFRKRGAQDQLHHLTKGLTPTVLRLFPTLCCVVAKQRPWINCPISHKEAKLGV